MQSENSCCAGSFQNIGLLVWFVCWFMRSSQTKFFYISTKNIKCGNTFWAIYIHNTVSYLNLSTDLFKVTVSDFGD